MRSTNYKPAVLLLIFLFFGNCKEDKDEFRICGNACPSSTPWRVESLDLGLPCFGTQEACRQWAATHGYGDKPCVRCD